MYEICPKEEKKQKKS